MPRVPANRDRMKERPWYKVTVSGPDRCHTLERWMTKLTGDYMMKRSASRIKRMGRRCDNDMQKLTVLIAEDEDFALLKLGGDFSTYELCHEKKFTRAHNVAPMGHH